MRLALTLVAASVGVLGGTQANPVTVRVSAPHPSLAARITGPRVTLLRGEPLRTGNGFVIVALPADVSIDPRLGEFYFRLEPDTAWVTLEVRGGGNTISASSRNVVVRYEDTQLQVVGVPPGRPGGR